MGPLSRAAAWLRLGRPHFLLGGLAMSAVGWAWARRDVNGLDAGPLVLGQALVTATQWMVHFANEAADVDADRRELASGRRRVWSGGSRVLAQGRLPVRVAARTAHVLLAAAAALAVACAFALPARLAWLPFAVVALSWAYDGEPLRLHRRGAGELVTGGVVGVLVPCLAYALQAGRLPADVALRTVPLGLAIAALVLALDLADAQGDRAAGKRTLAARVGRPMGSVVLAAALLATAGWLLASAGPPAWWASGAAAALAVASPFLSMRQSWDLLHGMLFVLVAGVAAAVAFT